MKGAVPKHLMMSDSGGNEIHDIENMRLSNRLPKADSVSSFMASENSSESSNPIAESAIREERPRKRRARHSRAKSLKVFINEEYRELYTSHIERVNSLSPENHDQQMTTSQFGASIWTATEKEVFFLVLARKGRHDIKGIAAEIGSKSEPEIAQYLDMLSRGLASSELSFRRPKFVDRPEYDAAYEMSIDCTSILEGAAEVLQNTEDKKVEKEQQGKLWLLTPKVNKWVENRLREGGEGDGEISQTLPAAGFLNLGQFLHLSKRFFMNSSDLEWNWRSYAVRPRAPTIMNTAFSEFHTLAISITKRLVQSSLYFAMSRLRAREASDHPPHRDLRKQDVLAALNVLGMPEKPRSHWTGVARRHKLNVFESVRYAKVSGKRYSYDEVEDLLSGDYNISSEDRASLQEDDGSIDEFEGIPSDSTSGTKSDINAEIINESDGSERSSIQQGEESLTGEEQEEQLQDDILEKLDQRHSRAEEKRMWKLLGEAPASKMGLEEENEKLQPLTAARKDRMELVDWTAWTDYGAEWETLKTLVPVEAFQNNRRLGKGRIFDEAEAQESDE